MVCPPSVQLLIGSFKFPRVVVELDYDDLELTDECKKDASKVTDKISKDRFFRNYGRQKISFGQSELEIC